jgi:hypothetical protein
MLPWRRQQRQQQQAMQQHAQCVSVDGGNGLGWNLLQPQYTYQLLKLRVLMHAAKHTCFPSALQAQLGTFSTMTRLCFS